MSATPTPMASRSRYWPTGCCTAFFPSETRISHGSGVSSSSVARPGHPGRVRATMGRSRWVAAGRVERDHERDSRANPSSWLAETAHGQLRDWMLAPGPAPRRQRDEPSPRPRRPPEAEVIYTLTSVCGCVLRDAEKPNAPDRPFARRMAGGRPRAGGRAHLAAPPGLSERVRELLDRRTTAGLSKRSPWSSMKGAPRLYALSTVCSREQNPAAGQRSASVDRGRRHHPRPPAPLVMPRMERPGGLCA